MEEIQDTLPPLSPASALPEREIDIEAPPAQRHNPEPASQNHPPPRPYQPHPEWLSLTMGFCFLAVSIAGVQCRDPCCPRRSASAFAESEIDIEAPPAQPHNPKPASQDHPPPRSHQPHPEWLSLIMGFCFLAVSIAGVQCRDPCCSRQSPGFLAACLSLVFALAAFVSSKYIHENLRATAQRLEYAGVFCGFTAFFLAITPTFPLCLKIISWAIYVTSIVAITLSRLNFF